MLDFSYGRFSLFTLSRSVTLLLCSALVLSACSSPNETSRSEQVAEAPTKLTIGTSIDIFSYANSQRALCFDVVHDTSVMLYQLKGKGDDLDTLLAAIKSDNQNIRNRLLVQLQKALEVPANPVKRPEFQLSSNSEFLTAMEQSISHCALSHANLLTHLLDSGEFQQVLVDNIPPEEQARRYRLLLLPQLKAMAMTYDFEHQEYMGLESSITAQAKFVWLMKHVYMTSIEAANSHIGNEPQKSADYYATELKNFLVLKDASAKELKVLSGLAFAIDIAQGNYLKNKEKNAKKVTLDQRLDKILSRFEPDYTAMLTELSKEQPDRALVQTYLQSIFSALLGRGEEVVTFRKHYFVELSLALQAYKK